MAIAFPEVPEPSVPELANQNCLSIEEARNAIKTKFTSYRQLLDKKELELLSELNQIEEGNKPELIQVQHDLDQLDGVMKNLDDSLGANTLKPFLEEQKNLLNKQISHFERCKKLLSTVALESSNPEYSIANLVKIESFLSKAKFRDKLHPLLELEPEGGECWYLVSENWFSVFSDSINLDNPLPNDSWEFPHQIPIDQTGFDPKEIDPGEIKLLHSDAWYLLLKFNNLSFGSETIERLTYFNDVTDVVEVPLNPVKHKLILAHIDKIGTNTFSIEIKLECYPSDTYEGLIDKFHFFSNSFTLEDPVVFAIDDTYTIVRNAPNFNIYTVDEVLQPNPVQFTLLASSTKSGLNTAQIQTGLGIFAQPGLHTAQNQTENASFSSYNIAPSTALYPASIPLAPSPFGPSPRGPSLLGPYPLAPIQDLNVPIGLNSQSILFAIPDSSGDTNIQVVTYLPELTWYIRNC